jgi:hypothetical protein
VILTPQEIIILREITVLEGNHTPAEILLPDIPQDVIGIGIVIEIEITTRSENLILQLTLEELKTQAPIIWILNFLLIDVDTL